ncbi:MAG: hypothetical protein QM737_18455 [Ferruginibacter sp.]
MKKLFLFILCYVSFIIALAQSKPQGVFFGLEDMCWKDSTSERYANNRLEKEERKYYRLSYIKIINDSVFLDQSAASIINGKDTFCSGSDWVYHYYSGIIKSTGNLWEINLVELPCDLCNKYFEKQGNGAYQRVLRKKIFSGYFVSSDLILNGDVFSKKQVDHFWISEYLDKSLKK